MKCVVKQRLAGLLAEEDDEDDEDDDNDVGSVLRTLSSWDRVLRTR